MCVHHRTFVSLRGERHDFSIMDSPVELSSREKKMVFDAAETNKLERFQLHVKN
jgi:hypothetical protein